jgi:hemoglobin
METLYSKLGPDMIRLLVDRFYESVFASPIIGDLFQTDKQVIKAKQYMFLTQFLGGPTLYSQQYGHPKMRMRHLPHAITDEAKDEWLRCMKGAIDSLPIDLETKSSLFNVFPQIAQHMVNS